MNLKIEICNSNWHFRFVTIQMQRQKNDDFILDTSFSCKKLSIEIVMKSFEPVILENSEFQHPTKSVFLLLWHEGVIERGVPAKSLSKLFLYFFWFLKKQNGERKLIRRSRKISNIGIHNLQIIFFR